MDRPHLSDATLAVANVVFEAARIPAHAVERLPGMCFLTTQGTYVRMRLRSRVEGVVVDTLTAPEVSRAIDRVVARVAREVAAQLETQRAHRRCRCLRPSSAPRRSCHRSSRWIRHAPRAALGRTLFGRLVFADRHADEVVTSAEMFGVPAGVLGVVAEQRLKPPQELAPAAVEAPSTSMWASPSSPWRTS